jgi:hypothetical protein
MSQNPGSTVERSWIARERIAETAFGAFAVAGLALCALWLQWRLGADSDVHWLNDLVGRWLDGQTPYVDFIEMNPPASLLLYVAPTALARAFKLRPDAVTQGCVLVAGMAELAIAAAVARRARLLQEFGTAGLFWGAAAIFLLPGSAFAERDHFGLIFALPVFAILPARALSRPVDAHWAIAGGLGAGCMLCLRPHYVLALAPPALYALYRSGWRGAAACLPEVAACALVLATYAATVVFFFPHFITDAIPLVTAVYVRDRAPFGWLFAQAWFLVWISLAGALWGTRRSLIASMPAQFLALASAGALACYLLQGKGWAYHLYVADALMLASFTIANRAALRLTGLDAPILAPALGVVSGLLVFTFLAQAEIPFVLLRYSLLPGLVILSVRLALAPPDDLDLPNSLRWTRLGVAVVAFASGEMAMLEGAHPRFFVAEMAELAPQPKIALVGGDGGPGIDLANQTGGTYVPRAYQMAILEDAEKILRRGGLSPETAGTLNRYIRDDRDRLSATVRGDRPDAIVVDPEWARTYLEPPFLHDLLDGYRLRATTKFPKRFIPTATLQLFTREPGL